MVYLTEIDSIKMSIDVRYTTISGILFLMYVQIFKSKVTDSRSKRFAFFKGVGASNMVRICNERECSVQRQHK